MATFFQSLVMLPSNPALQDAQLKHKTAGLFPHALQSGLEKFPPVVVQFVGEKSPPVVVQFVGEKSPPVVFVQFVGEAYVKLQSFDGLQQPDCRSTKHIGRHVWFVKMGTNSN